MEPFTTTAAGSSERALGIGAALVNVSVFGWYTSTADTKLPQPESEQSFVAPEMSYTTPPSATAAPSSWVLGTLAPWVQLMSVNGGFLITWL